MGHTYTNRTDAWSLGVLAYELLVGKSPFACENQLEMFKRIELVDYSFPDTPALSVVAKSFIRSLLQVNPENRMTLEAAGNHAWIRQRDAI